MTTLTLSPARGAASKTGRIAAFFHEIAAEMRARRAARSVEALSDQVLHDIGIARGEIDSAVRIGRRHA